MSRVDQRALRSAGDAYAAARRNYEAAQATANRAYERLQASPETLEYQIDWNVARRREAAATWRVKAAEEHYRKAGGYLAETDE